MIRVETLTLTDVRLKQTREYFDAGTGPYLVEYEASAPAPSISNGFYQEGSLTDFIMLEDGASFLLQE